MKKSLEFKKLNNNKETLTKISIFAYQIFIFFVNFIFCRFLTPSNKTVKVVRRENYVNNSENKKLFTKE